MQFVDTDIEEALARLTHQLTRTERDCHLAVLRAGRDELSQPLSRTGAPPYLHLADHLALAIADAADACPGQLDDLLRGERAGALTAAVRDLHAAGRLLQCRIASSRDAGLSEFASTIVECVRVCTTVNARSGDSRFTFPLLLAAATGGSHRSITEAFTEMQVPPSPPRLSLSPTATAALATILDATSDLNEVG